MRIVVRLCVTCLVCCVGLFYLLVAGADGASSSIEAGGEVLGDSLVVAGSPIEGEQRMSQEEVRRASPEAVAEREASSTAFEGLGSSKAANLAAEAFPTAIDEGDGGPPKLPAGQQISSYLTDNVARVALPGDGHGVIESSLPMAVETSPEQWLPVDLGVREAGNAFALTRPVVALSIPKQLQEGVALAGSGVSLKPLNAAGAAVGGSEGAVDGAVVFYGDVGMGSDVDVVVKPLTAGFEEDALLRSVRSPQQLSFRLELLR